MTDPTLMDFASSFALAFLVMSPLILCFGGLWRPVARFAGLDVHVWGRDPERPRNPYSRVCKHCGARDNVFGWPWGGGDQWERVTDPHTPAACAESRNAAEAADV